MDRQRIGFLHYRKSDGQKTDGPKSDALNAVIEGSLVTELEERLNANVPSGREVLIHSRDANGQPSAMRVSCEPLADLVARLDSLHAAATPPPAKSEPAKVEPAKSDPPKVEPAKSEPAKPAPANHAPVPAK